MNEIIYDFYIQRKNYRYKSELFYSTLYNNGVLNPTLSIKRNTSGKMECVVTPKSPYYSSINNLMTTYINIFYRTSINEKYYKFIWGGRIINVQTDFSGNKKIVCEGILSYLSDAIVQTDGQKMIRFPDDLLRDLINYYYSLHWSIDNNPNTKIILDNQFSNINYSLFGDSTQTMFLETDFEWSLCGESVLDIFNSIVSDYAYTVKLKVDDIYSDNIYSTPLIYKLSCLQASDLEKSSSTFNNPYKLYFGKDIIDFKSERNCDNIFSVIFPLGENIYIEDPQYQAESSDPENNISPDDGESNHENDQTSSEPKYIKTDRRVSLYALPSSYDDIYNVNGYKIVDNALVDKYGVIEKTIVWDNIDNPVYLAGLAHKLLQTNYFNVYDVKITARIIDPFFTNNSSKPLELYDYVILIDEYFGKFDALSVDIDKNNNITYSSKFIITGIDYDFNNPTNNSYEIMPTHTISNYRNYLINSILNADGYEKSKRSSSAINKLDINASTNTKSEPQDL